MLALGKDIIHIIKVEDFGLTVVEEQWFFLEYYYRLKNIHFLIEYMIDSELSHYEQQIKFLLF